MHCNITTYGTNLYRSLSGKIEPECQERAEQAFIECIFWYISYIFHRDIEYKIFL